MKTRPALRWKPFSDMRSLFALAKQTGVSLVPLTILTAFTSILFGVVQWLFLPLVVLTAEQKLPLLTVCTAAVVLTTVLFVVCFLKRYTEGVFAENRDCFRTRGSTLLVRKALTVSYPQAVGGEESLRKAASAMGRHIHAPIPHAFETLASLLACAVTALLFSAVLCYGAWWIALIALTSAVSETCVHRLVTKLGASRAAQEQTHDAQMAYAAAVSRSSDYAKDIRVFGLADWLTAIGERSGKLLRTLLERRAKLYFLYDLADTVMSLLRNGAVYGVLLVLVLEGTMTLSQFILVFTATACFTQSVSGLLTNVWTLRAEQAQLRIYRDYLEQEEPFRFADGEAPAKGCFHTLECRGVSFTCPGEDVPVLKCIDVVLRPGEKLAIVDEDGRAASALAKLLCGLYDPDDGVILLDGADVRCLDRRCVYDLFSTVLQGRPLLDMTILEIVGGAVQAQQDRVWDCLSRVGLEKTVRSFPLGLSTTVGRQACDDGVELSGGQTRRLLLARALYKNADIWVLEDPTTALDPLAEHAVYEECLRLIGKRSAVVISHHLAQARLCDRILYLKDGVVAEEGTHEELLALRENYARLFALQGRHYREGRDPDA